MVFSLLRCPLGQISPYPFSFVCRNGFFLLSPSFLPPSSPRDYTFVNFRACFAIRRLPRLVRLSFLTPLPRSLFPLLLGGNTSRFVQVVLQSILTHPSAVFRDRASYVLIQSPPLRAIQCLILSRSLVPRFFICFEAALFFVDSYSPFLLLNRSCCSVRTSGMPNSYVFFFFFWIFFLVFVANTATKPLPGVANSDAPSP